MGGISKLDGDGVPNNVAKAPVGITQGIEKAVVASDHHTHNIAVGGLGEVEDPRDL